MIRLKTYKELFESYDDLTEIETTDYYNFILDVIYVVSPSMLKLARKKGTFNRRYIKYDKTILDIKDDIEFELIIYQDNKYYDKYYDKNYSISNKGTNKSDDLKISTYKGFDYNDLFDVIEKYTDITFIYNGEKISRKMFFAKKKSKKFNL